jgi:hypothetical protein
MWWSLLACGDDPAGPDAIAPVLDAPVFVVPGAGLPPELTPQASNNNLAVTWHGGRRFLAWRTAPSHFASPRTTMNVVSSEDGDTWRFEGTFALGTDVREPHLLSFEGHLWLTFAVLGDNELDFEPQGAKRAEYLGPGEWTDLEDVYEPTFIPWRMRVVDGVPMILGYVGGENIYDADGEPVRIHWLRAEDGTTYAPFVGSEPVVHEGGGSETDLVFLDDGSIVATIRNEAGENGVFGSLICTAPADDLGTWTCDPDPRKYDSPLMFRAADRVWLVGRRNVTETGAYDLTLDGMDPQEEYLTYQLAYWQEPKRCALWEVHPETRTVDWVLDLPSSGDTCFPDLLDLPDGSFELWNYTSPLETPDLSWLEGQTGQTSIYRIRLHFD